MKIRTIASAAAATLLSAGMVSAAATPAVAVPQTAPDGISAEMFSALQRDLKLSPAEARTRLTLDDQATRTEQKLRADLGARFGGAWLNADAGQVVVAVTDAAAADAVRAQGATAKVVARSEAQLNAAKNKLDTTAAPAGVTGWYVDLATNAIVVEALPSAAGAARKFATAAGAGVAQVRQVAEAPRTFYDVRGGDAFYMGGGRCSVGFSVTTGFVTAGHCGTTGTAAQGSNQVAMGTFAGSSFPSDDYAYVRTNTNWVPRGVVNRYSGSTTVAVRGSQEAAVGASICRSGSTTGWRCGTVQAKNQTIRYAEGSVSGLTRTNACAEPGDSGGSWLSGNQAQGVTSGGSGNCSTGGTTYFQPVNEILSRYGLTLVTS
ncbi:MAG: S1 family peptidase [Actinoplanes sp.]